MTSNRLISAMQGSNAIKALKVLKTKEAIQHNLSDSSLIDLRKAYLSKQWEAIQELFQILGFTGIDNMCTFSKTPDLNSAIKAINAIAGNWCRYTVKSAPELSPYRSKTDNKIQELFDSIEQEK
ncbi:hypothetical protein C1645_829277 [Glomus cerebriforme]|uniref:Uncharacterized protein n=1 Tax=Glomus cerebriforme TaxID=658196 RepID=A0A397SPC0_9GLOM|nr:hypothetical protein C1645_829277 [Glomus cerebriforme]